MTRTVWELARELGRLKALAYEIRSLEEQDATYWSPEEIQQSQLRHIELVMQLVDGVKAFELPLERGEQ